MDVFEWILEKDETTVFVKEVFAIVDGDEYFLSDGELYIQVRKFISIPARRRMNSEPIGKIVFLIRWTVNLILIFEDELLQFDN